MHVSALLSRIRAGTVLSTRILRATGFTSALLPVGLALLVVLIFPDGLITRLGPLPVQPAVSVVLLVPLLLSTGCAVAHATWRSAVLHQVARVRLARAGSYVMALALGMVIVGVAGRLGTTDLSAGMLRNLLWLTGVALTVLALFGITYTWLPGVLAMSVAVLSASTENPWTVYGMLFLPEATSGQLGLSAAVCGLGLALAVLDPVGRGYLGRR